MSEQSAPRPRDAGGAVAIACRGLVKRYADVVAVDGLDLEIARGECFGLLGPNGAGKTTTIEILEGLLDPDSGDVEILGRSWRRDAQAIRERIGIQLQETLLGEKLSVVETLRMFRSFYATGRDVDEVLRLVELESKRDAWIGKLSGGQKQRVALACALVGRPELLFLDEPTTGLDPQSRRQLWELLERFRAEGGTILLTTHYMDEAELLCDRIAVVDKGKVIARGTPRELIASLGADHIVEFSLEEGVSLPSREALASLAGVRDVRIDAGRVSLNCAQIHAAVPALMESLGRDAERLASLSTHGATLEDVFVHLTGRHLRDA